MIWLSQQRKVDALSARASVRARQAARFRLKIHLWRIRAIRQPETLAWAFAVGALVGAGADPKEVRRTKTLLRWLNFASTVWGVLGKTIQPAQKSLESGEREAASPGQ